MRRRRAPVAAGHARAGHGRVLAELTELRERVGALHEALLRKWPMHRLPPDAAAATDASERPAPELYATLLGAFALYRGRARLQLGNNRSVVDLCRYLVAHAGRPVARDALIELLWPGSEPTRAVHRLHVAVSQLRAALGNGHARQDMIVCEDERYLVPLHAVATDCERFDELSQMPIVQSDLVGKGVSFDHGFVVNPLCCPSRTTILTGRYSHGTDVYANDHDGAAAALGAAVEVAAGEYMADQPYADWALSRRTRYAERRLNALMFLCEHALLRNHPAQAIDYAQQILAIDGLRERAHRHLMRAQCALGQRACAVRQYRRCAATLQRALGIPPSCDTQRLYEAVLGEAELPAEPPLRL